MSAEVEIDVKLLVHDTLVNTYVMVFGNMPDEGSHTPDASTMAVLTEMFGTNLVRIRRYCCDAMLTHVWTIKKANKRTPFFVNSMLVSSAMVAFIQKHRTFLRTRFGSLISEPDNYFNEVYAEVYETELDYLNIAAESAFRGLEMDWEIISPTLYWYLLAVTGVKDMPCGRLDKDDVPDRWTRIIITHDDIRVTLDIAVGKERKKLHDIAARNVFIQAAERALYDASFQWSIRYRLIRTFQNGEGKPTIAKDFSALTTNDLMLHYPLVDRDKEFFATAKKALLEKGHVIEPLPAYEEMATKDVDADANAGTRGSGILMRGDKSLTGALSAASKVVDG